MLGAIRVPVFGHEYYIVVGSCQSLPLRFASDLEKCWQRSVPNDSEMNVAVQVAVPLALPCMFVKHYNRMTKFPASRSS